MKTKYTFFLNWMGPVATSWYEENNIPYTMRERYSSLFKEVLKHKEYEQYSCGRIDIHHPSLPYGEEYGLSPMKSRSWYKLQNWLDNLELDELPSKSELLEMFEADTKHKIEWYKYR